MARLSESTRELLEVRERANSLQLLFKCARLATEHAMARVNEQAGRPALKGAHTALLPHLDGEGVRVVELARKLEISKQAVSQTLAEMAEAGVVELAPDPSDGRAKLARLTPCGAATMAQGLFVLESLESELSHEIGEARMLALHDALVALVGALES